MNWKRVAKLAKLAAYAVVPGAAGYVVYRHVVRPWLDNRAAKGTRPRPQMENPQALSSPSAEGAGPDASASFDPQKKDES